MRKQGYCFQHYAVKGVKRNPNPKAFNVSGRSYESLGDRITKSLEIGADLGSPAVVNYAEFDDMDNVDVMSSPNHDMFDIAEQFGEKIAQGVGAPPKVASDSPDSVIDASLNAPVNPDPVTE